jgi:hypothetical protein
MKKRSAKSAGVEPRSSGKRRERERERDPRRDSRPPGGKRQQRRSSPIGLPAGDASPAEEDAQVEWEASPERDAPPPRGLPPRPPLGGAAREPGGSGSKTSLFDGGDGAAKTRFLSRTVTQTAYSSTQQQQQDMLVSFDEDSYSQSQYLLEAGLGPGVEDKSDEILQLKMDAVSSMLHDSDDTGLGMRFSDSFSALASGEEGLHWALLLCSL